MQNAVMNGRVVLTSASQIREKVYTFWIFFVCHTLLLFRVNLCPIV